MQTNDTEVLAFLTENMDIHLKLCLDQQHPSGWSEVRSKVDYDLWIVLNGKIRVSYRKTSYTLLPGDMFLIYPQEKYEALNIGAPNENCHILFTHFDVVLGKNLRTLDEFAFDGKIPAETIKAQYEAFYASYIRYKAGGLFSTLELRGSFLTLFSRLLIYQNANRRRNVPTSKGHNLSRLNSVLHYIDTSTKQDITVAKLASLMGISEKYFIALFKDTVGISPQQYVIRRKMERALQYLYEGSLSVTEIAAMTGYQDLYAFSKAFKKIYGVSPSKIQ